MNFKKTLTHLLVIVYLFQGVSGFALAPTSNFNEFDFVKMVSSHQDSDKVINNIKVFFNLKDLITQYLLYPKIMPKIARNFIFWILLLVFPALAQISPPALPQIIMNQGDDIITLAQTPELRKNYVLSWTFDDEDTLSIFQAACDKYNAENENKLEKTHWFGEEKGYPYKEIFFIVVNPEGKKVKDTTGIYEVVKGLQEYFPKNSVLADLTPKIVIAPQSKTIYSGKDRFKCEVDSSGKMTVSSSTFILDKGMMNFVINIWTDSLGASGSRIDDSTMSLKINMPSEVNEFVLRKILDSNSIILRDIASKYSNKRANEVAREIMNSAKYNGRLVDFTSSAADTSV